MRGVVEEETGSCSAGFPLQLLLPTTPSEEGGRGVEERCREVVGKALPQGGTVAERAPAHHTVARVPDPQPALLTYGRT